MNKRITKKKKKFFITIWRGDNKKEYVAENITHFSALYRSFSWLLSGGSHSNDANANAVNNWEKNH